MQVLDTRGHTPGHISLQLAGGNGAGSDGLVITGDAATSNIVFLEHPDWHFGFDTDAEMALKNRKALIDRAASERLTPLGYRWPIRELLTDDLNSCVPAPKAWMPMPAFPSPMRSMRSRPPLRGRGAGC